MKLAVNLILNSIVVGFLLLQTVIAESIYQQPKDFVNQAFNNNAPVARILWLTSDELKQNIKKLLGHDYARFRLRYHLQGQRSVWILDEVGKEKAITVGVVIEKKAIQQLKVLIFRESRGWEIRHDFFTDQFKDIQLNKDLKIDKNIDNISGATLSVRAVKKLAALALYLHQYVTKQNE